MSDLSPRPVPAQQEAIDDRGRDLFLSAGAGTGKTTVLVQRFCDAVCSEHGDEAGVGIENVLAFTFTDRAAGELKQRIRSELARRADAAHDPGRARRLRSLARESESAWVSTIHAFCRRVLASHPLAAGLDPSFRVLDETQSGRIAGDAFDAAFARFAEGGDDDRFEMAAAFRVTELGTIVRAAHDELRSRGVERPTLPELAGATASEALGELRSAAEDALAATEAARGNRYVDDARALLADALAATEGGAPSSEDVAAWEITSKAKPLKIPEIERYKQAHATLEQRLLEERFAHQYEHLRELLELYDEEYRRRKEERSALDYEDLQLRARALLRDRPDVRARYRHQFSHLMVDEFQDTNELQLAIVRLLHLEDGEPENRRFTVGDELQSVYSFRHADVEVFRSERARAEAAPETEAGVRRLGGNFRSRPEVLALVNRVGAALFGDDYEALAPGKPGGAVDAPAGVEAAAAPRIEVLFTEKEGWKEAVLDLDISSDEQAPPWRAAEARFVATRLRELHDEGVPRGDMVVLLRSFSFVETYANALDDAGLAPYVVGGRGYWSKQQVADVRNLLACIANPLDDRALFGVLASPACGASSDALWLVRHAAGTRRPVWPVLLHLYGPPIEAGDEPIPEGVVAWRSRVEEAGMHMPAADKAALEGLTTTLIGLRAEAPRRSLEELIDRAITATGYDLALLMRGHGRRRMANVRKLMRLAREYEAEAGRDLRGFLDHASEEADSSSREAEAAVDAEGHDGVRVMTVHSAKGLEFPVVAVADLGRSLAASRPPALRLEPVPDREGGAPDDRAAMRVGLRLARLGHKRTPIFDYAELEAAAVERERREERRILHVAMTRAEDRLLLSGALERRKLAEEPSETEPLIGAVVRALGWDGEAGSLDVGPPPLRAGLEGNLPAASVRVSVNEAGEPAGQSGSGRRPAPGPGPDATPLEETPLPDPDLEPLAAASASPVRAVSYSALALHERCGYRFYAERVLGMRPRLPGRGAHGADGSNGSASEERVGAPGRDRDEWHLDGTADADDEALATRYARGRAVHELLERSARAAWSAPDATHAAALLRREGVSAGPAQVRRTLALVERFLGSGLRSELADAPSIHPEAPFAFRVGGVLVRGEIDLLADLGGETLVLDYKSDALGATSPAEHIERYRVQRRIYALAALRRYGRPVRVVYVFLERPDEPVEERFGPDDVARLTGDLAATAEEIVGGRFEVTDAPERTLCFDCPARERLCVHGPELTLRDRVPA